MLARLRPLSTFFPSSPPHPSKIWFSLYSTLTPLAATQRTCPPTSYSLPLQNLKFPTAALVPTTFLGVSSTFLATLSVVAVFQLVLLPCSFLEAPPVPLGPEGSVWTHQKFTTPPLPLLLLPETPRSSLPYQSASPFRAACPIYPTSKSAQKFSPLSASRHKFLLNIFATRWTNFPQGTALFHLPIVFALVISFL
jgi:hypothetical protein